MSYLKPAWQAALLAQKLYKGKTNSYEESLLDQISREVALVASTGSDPRAVSTAWLRLAPQYDMSQQQIVQQVGREQAESVFFLQLPGFTASTVEKEDRLYRLKKQPSYVQTIEIARLIVEFPNMIRCLQPANIQGTSNLYKIECHSVIKILTKADSGLIQYLTEQIMGLEENATTPSIWKRASAA